jgi:hypothetical protein
MFAAINLPALTGGLSWNTSQLYSSGRLLVSAAAPGFSADFDNDGDVDGDDLAQWRGDFGANSSSDADDDGDSDGDDFLAWQQQLGKGSAIARTGAAVPEPAALLLIVLAGWHSLSIRATIDAQPAQRKNS